MGWVVIIEEVKNQESYISVPGRTEITILQQWPSFPWSYCHDNTGDSTFHILCKRCCICHVEHVTVQ